MGSSCMDRVGGAMARSGSDVGGGRGGSRITTRVSDELGSGVNGARRDRGSGDDDGRRRRRLRAAATVRPFPAASSSEVRAVVQGIAIGRCTTLDGVDMAMGAFSRRGGSSERQVGEKESGKAERKNVDHGG